MASLRTPFFGARVPAGLSSAVIKSVARVPADVRSELILLATEYVLGSEPNNETVKALLGRDGLTAAIINDGFALIMCLLVHGLRLPSLKPTVFREDLIDIGVPPEVVSDVSDQIYGSRREALTEACKGEAPRGAHLETFKWRVDATISTNTLAKVLKPTVTMQMTLSTGTVSTFEVPMKQLHELRYSVAQILKEMNQLESRNIFKIVD